MRKNIIVAVFFAFFFGHAVHATINLSDVQYPKCDPGEPGGLRKIQDTHGNSNTAITLTSTPENGTILGVPASGYFYYFTSTEAAHAQHHASFSISGLTSTCAVIVQSGCGCPGNPMNTAYMQGGWFYSYRAATPFSTVIFPNPLTPRDKYPDSSAAGNTLNTNLPGVSWTSLSDIPTGTSKTPFWPSSMTNSDCDNLFVNFYLLGCGSSGGSGDAGGLSDPHIITWDGIAQTVFHEGDFLLAESRATGMAVQGRFCKSSRGPWAPWICALAVRCSADTKAVELTAAAWGVLPASSTDVAVSETRPGMRTLQCASGLTVHAKLHRFHRHPYINTLLSLASHATADVRGLLGTPDAKGDDLQSRDGQVTMEMRGEHLIGHSLPTLDEIHDTWRVHASESMFSSIFTPLAGSLVADSRRTHSAKATSAAEAACRAQGLTDPKHVAICAYDVAAFRHPRLAAEIASFLADVPASTTELAIPEAETMDLYFSVEA
mmetsp:Transcript_14383/g.24524  ORF Transcript_14383/g.24524 Transcript_14383/m.24524 type:complete len:491 (-) Transcript_14383:407-1879(-)|eukprot:CAMPEP_0196651818 /NCGR_PEP_ID=MMETSP1086-20130531/951_1 /TAXON_ID=77921 /ORGANISM="Cyanoptyche  gloeocystis , Strain SAG4.97" /LENGTH=490 /DNA_ID=CAMNT_0041982041 /DNA_START=337 /DNA_END=1809 /DNA_ORIENTATION=+